MKNEFNHIVEELSKGYPRKEAESIGYYLLEEKYQIRKTDIHLDRIRLDPRQKEALKKDLQQLKNNVPVQYVVGYGYFFALKFLLSKDVLIPRPETEELVSLVIRQLKKTNPAILDIGCGSGCISITLKKEVPGAIVTGTDVSGKVLDIAKRNAFEHKTPVKFILSNILNKNEWKSMDELFDIIISNPPYITEKEKKQMHKNVLEHEPPQALFIPDDDPLLFYDKISDFGLEKLKNGGMLYLEINENYGRETQEMLESKSFKNIQLIRDLHNKDRMISCSR